MKNSPSMKRALLLCLVVMGCAEDLGVQGIAKGPANGDDEYDPVQGRYIIGSVPDQLIKNNRHFRIGQVAVGGMYVVTVSDAASGAKLIATGAAAFEGDDDRFNGLVFNGVDGGKVRIVDARPYPHTNSTSYFLEYKSQLPGSTWVDFCANGEGAIPLHGHYNIDRFHLNTPEITFACPDSISWKCSTLWGYVAGNDFASPDWSFHQACTRMGNASYCEDRNAFTREETPIQIRDFEASYGMPDILPNPDLDYPNPLPGDLDTFYIEAAWPAVGGPICLSRSRWAGLPPNPCPGVIRDPRFDGDPEVKFCEDIPLDVLNDVHGALIINGSKMMDAPMRLWKKDGQYLSTIRGYDLTYPGAVDDPPFKDTGYVFQSVNHMILRSLPGTLDAAIDMIPLYVQRAASSGGNDIVVSVDLPGTHTRGEFEGYSFKDQLPNNSLRRLVLYKKGNDHVTLISGTQPSGYVAVNPQPVLGWVLPPP